MSHERFEIGEVVKLHRLLTRPEWNGLEVTITHGEQDRTGTDPDGLPLTVYGFRCVAPWWPKPIYVRRVNLKKRRPPQDWVKLCNLTDVPREVSHV